MQVGAEHASPAVRGRAPSSRWGRSMRASRSEAELQLDYFRQQSQGAGASRERGGLASGKPLSSRCQIALPGSQPPT